MYFSNNTTVEVSIADVRLLVPPCLRLGMIESNQMTEEDEITATRHNALAMLKDLAR